jgi:membrane protease YdiL (CAAX protease family)
MEPGDRIVNGAGTLKEEGDTRKAVPWGFWASIGFSITILLAYFLIQSIVVVAFFIAGGIEHPESNGLLLALATILSAPLSMLLIVLFAKLRKDFPLRDYFGFRQAARAEWVRWLLLLCAFMAAFDVITYLLNRPIVPACMVEAYKTAYFPPVLYVALLIMAPLFEELLFRGFLFEGIRHSRLGAVGAVALTALGWSVLHVQYDVYNIASIFLFAILLGLARIRTGSVCVTIIMHGVNNFVATLEVLLKVHFFS